MSQSGWQRVGLRWHVVLIRWQRVRGLACKGVANKNSYRMHRLAGSLFQGHRYLGAEDILGILACFGSGKDTELTALDTGISRQVLGFLLDRPRMAAVLVTERDRESIVFSDCQVEADESVVRNERVYTAPAKGQPRQRTGTSHHSVIVLSQRGSPRQVLYSCTPNFVPVSESGKPSPPSLPTIDLVLPLLAKHFGKFVVLHTDGAEAYKGRVRSVAGRGV